MKTLSEFAQEKARFVTMKDGIPYSGIYKGYTYFNKDNNGEIIEVARYLIEDLKDGITRNLDSGAAGLARQMANITKGSVIKLTRTGKGFDTKWKVETPAGQAESTGSESAYDGDEIKEEDIPVLDGE